MRSNLHWSEFGNWKTVISASWKLDSELIESIYSLVVVDVESGIDINEDNFSYDVPGNELRKWFIQVIGMNKTYKYAINDQKFLILRTQ